MSKDIREEQLRQELAKQDFELIRHSEWDTNGHLQVEVKKLQAVHINNQSLFVPVMTMLSIILDKDNKISNIVEHPSVKDNISDAEHFVKTLIDNKKLKGLNMTAADATHEIELNEKGQQVIKRKRYNSF